MLTDKPRALAEPDGGGGGGGGGGTIARMISGGNCHAEPVALATDAMTLAIVEGGVVAERRIAMRIDTSVSRLPPSRTADARVNSVFVIAQVTPAALAIQNKSLARPASADRLPASATQEDPVSVAAVAARRLRPMIRSTARLLGTKLPAAVQGVELLQSLRSSVALEARHALLSKR